MSSLAFVYFDDVKVWLKFFHSSELAFRFFFLLLFPFSFSILIMIDLVRFGPILFFFLFCFTLPSLTLDHDFHYYLLVLFYYLYVNYSKIEMYRSCLHLILIDILNARVYCSKRKVAKMKIGIDLWSRSFCPTEWIEIFLHKFNNKKDKTKEIGIPTSPSSLQSDPIIFYLILISIFCYCKR